MAARLFLPMFESTVETRTEMENSHLAKELKRWKDARDLGELIQEREENIKANATAKEAAKVGMRAGGIGTMHGKPVFGSVEPRDDEDHGEITTLEPFYVSKNALKATLAYA